MNASLRSYLLFLVGNKAKQRLKILVKTTAIINCDHVQSEITYKMSMWFKFKVIAWSSVSSIMLKLRKHKIEDNPKLP